MASRAHWELHTRTDRQAGVLSAHKDTEKLTLPTILKESTSILIAHEALLICGAAEIDGMLHGAGDPRQPRGGH